MRRSIALVILTCLLAFGTGSVAETQSPSASPVPVGQRIEVLGDGFALTFPDAWRIRSGLRDQGERDVLVVTAEAPESEHATCDAWRETPTGLWLPPIEEIAESLLDQRRFHPPLPVITRDALHWPGGDAVLVHAEWSEGTKLGQSETWYVWRRDEDDDWAHFTLHCVVDARGSAPEDRWLSIAETFEFQATGA